MRIRLYSILNGDTKASSIYGRVMTVLIVASLVPLCFKESNIALDAVEYICVSIFTVDYLLRWLTADVKFKRGAISFLIYPFTPMAIVDLLSILPTYIAINGAFRTLRVLRMLRLMRAFRIIRYSKSINLIADVIREQRQALLTVFGLAIAYVLVSAIVVFNVEPDTFDGFFDALYWAVVSLTTVGYGDLYPASDAGRIVAMVSAIMGIAVVALPAGIITAGFMDNLGSDENGNEIQEIEKDIARREIKSV